MDIFTLGDRVRDDATGVLGTHAGIGYLRGRIVTLVHWDGASNPAPLHPHQGISYVPAVDESTEMGFHAG